MGTFKFAIISTRGRDDFWQVLSKYGVQRDTENVPPHVVVDLPLNLAHLMSPHFADFPPFFQEISRELQTDVLTVFAQTTSSTFEVHAFAKGELVRILTYLGDEPEPWQTTDGEVQAWEQALFFPGQGGSAVLEEDLDEESIDRYQTAETIGDPTKIFDLLRLGGGAHVERLLRFFLLDLRTVHGTLETKARPRLFGIPLAAMLFVLLALCTGMYLLGRMTKP